MNFLSRSRTDLCRLRALFLISTALTLSAPAQTPSDSLTPAPPARVAVAEETIVLSAFEVSAAADQGYRAGNSVSATRIDTPIKNLPFAISAFTSQFVSDVGARELFDVAQYSPSVTNASVEFALGNTFYSVRGFAQYPQRNGFPAAYYVDAATVERVEVVKGPASLLYGEVSPGGLVNYITKRPASKAFTSVTAKVGSYEYARGAIDVNRPLIGDSLLFRFNGAWENDITYFEPGKSRTTVVAPVVLWRPNDRVSVLVDYQNMQRRESPPFQTRLPTSRIVAPPPASGILSTASVLQRPSGEDPGFVGFYPLPNHFNISAHSDRRDSENEALVTEVTMKLTDRWTARANFNWSKYKVWFKGTGLGQINVTVPARYFGSAPYPTSANATYLAAAAQFAADLLRDPALALEAPHAQMQRRLNLQETFGHGKASQVELAGKLTWGGVDLKPLFGVSYFEYKDNTRMRQAPTAAFPTPWNMYNPSTWNRDTNYIPADLPLTQFDRGVRRSQATYAVLNASAFEGRLYSVAGARYTETSGSNDNFLNPSGSLPKARASKLTPQIGAGWKVHPDVLLFASYSESFQNSVANLQVANTPTGPAQPTTAKGYEAGIKTDLFDGRVSSTLSVFTIDQRDRIIGFNTTSPTGLIQVNRMQGTLDRSEGVELEITWSPLDNFQIYASGSINHVEVVSTPPGTEYLLGSQPENTVKKLANLWARYTFRDGPLAGMWLGGGFNHSGPKAQRVNNPKLFTDPFTIYNAAAGYEWKWAERPVSVTVNVNNLTDESYVPAAFLRGRPRTITMEWRLKF